MTDMKGRLNIYLRDVHEPKWTGTLIFYKILWHYKNIKWNREEREGKITLALSSVSQVSHERKDVVREHEPQVIFKIFHHLSGVRTDLIRRPSTVALQHKGCMPVCLSPGCWNASGHHGLRRYLRKKGCIQKTEICYE